MKPKSNSWTEKEDNRLIAIVSENKYYLQKAFRLFHEEYPKRTIPAISNRWYSKLRLKDGTKTCFVNVQKQSKRKSSLWNRIINLIFRRK